MEVSLALCVVAAVCALAVNIRAAEILLVFPLPMKSHYYTLLPLINSLADKGHHVTSYSSLPFGPHLNITEHLFDYDLPAKLGKKDMTKMGTSVTLLMEIHDMGYQSALSFFKTKQFRELMKSTRKYDALITVNIIQEYLAALQHKFNTTNIEILPHANSPVICLLNGIPFNPSYYVDVKLPYTDRMVFMERLHNTYNVLVSWFVTYFIIIRRMANIADQYIRYPNWEYRPPLERLIMNKSLILVNGHHVLNYPYPLPPHVRDIAGISIRPNQPLPKNIEDFITSWPNGVIVLSWGSAVTGSMADSAKTDKILLSAFAELKYGVLFKNVKYLFCTKQIARLDNYLTNNIIIPSHKNVKVFLTHGGYNSIVETTHYGVPVVLTPFFMDQRKNARKLIEVKVGVQLLPENLTKESLIWAINEVAANHRYKDAAIKRSEMFRDRPMSPAQEAVYWIEYVIRHGDVLRPASTEMSFFQLLLLDVMAFSVLI
uniref:Uncharacterized protein n=1 Tax=Rhodnius prolixus TaxID=13249 RepID=T1IAY6_RHOPR